VRAIIRGDDHWARWLSAEVRAELAGEYIQDLDLPEYRRRTRTSVAGTEAARMCDEDPEISVVRTIGLGWTVEVARAPEREGLRELAARHHGSARHKWAGRVS
jgi:hypothetical protein